MIMNLTEQDIFISANRPYLRPLLCKGDAEKAKVMLVGINPASPIYPTDIGFKEYLELCNDYEKFMTFYKKKRHNSGKPDISRTRIGITAFAEWLKHHLFTDVIETDICTYPTAYYKELQGVPEEIIKQGQDLFWRIVTSASACEIAILYGEAALKWFIELLVKKSINLHILNNLEGKVNHVLDFQQYSMKELEKSSPIFQIYLPDQQVTVFAARHLMYYGNCGNSYILLKKSILNYQNSKIKEDIWKDMHER